MPTPHSATVALRQAVTPALPDGPPVNLALAREQLDNRAFLQGAARGALWGDVAVTVGGDAAAPSLATPLLEAAVVRDPNVVWRVAGRSAGTVAPGPLAASTVHYLYLRSDADGVYSYVVSTAAPTGCYRITGNELQRFLAAFATGLLGYPLPAVVRERSGRYVASSGRAELVALDNGRATAWAAVDLSHLVPPSATTAWVMVRAKCAAADAGASVQVRRSSADGGSFVAVTAAPYALVITGTPTNVDGTEERLVQVPLLSQGFEYQLSAAVTASDPYGARFTVVGWEG